MAVLLALATLREPVPVPPAEAAVWTDSAQYMPTSGQDFGAELAAAADAQVDVAEGTTLLQPVAISDDVAFDAVGADGSAMLDEARAGAIALRLASRLAWQVTGSFTFAPFSGVWAGPWPVAPAMDSGIAIAQ